MGSFKEVKLNYDSQKVRDFINSATGETKESKKAVKKATKNSAKLKTEQIAFKVSPAQKAEIFQKADENNMSVSQYILIKIFGLK